MILACVSKQLINDEKTKKKTNKEMWEKYEMKLNFIRSKGYGVMIIWESEYLQTPDIIIKKIEDFLYDKN